MRWTKSFRRAALLAWASGGGPGPPLRRGEPGLRRSKGNTKRVWGHMTPTHRAVPGVSGQVTLCGQVMVQRCILEPYRRRAGDSLNMVIAYVEGIVVYSSAARDHIPLAVPSGTAQEVRCPPSDDSWRQRPCRACQWFKCLELGPIVGPPAGPAAGTLGHVTTTTSTMEYYDETPGRGPSRSGFRVNSVAAARSGRPLREARAATVS